MTWTPVEKRPGTIGDMTYLIGVRPPDGITELCGFLRCTVVLTGITPDSVEFTMSVMDEPLPGTGGTCRVGGETIDCYYKCSGMIIIFTLAFPDKISEYKENDAWVFWQNA